MKQTKKINRGWKFSSMLPLAGIMAITMGWAAPAIAGPDLQVRVWVDANSVHKNANNTYNFTIRGQLKNVGNTDYAPHKNSPVLFLHEVGRSHHIADWHFTRLNRGRVMNVHVPVRNHPGGEFVPAYELALSFGKQNAGSDPANNDLNRRNNQATVSSRTLSAAFARASSGVRGVHVRPVGVRPGNIRPTSRLSPQMHPGMGHKRVTLKKLVGNRLYEIRKNGKRGYAPDGVYDIGKGMLKVRGGRVIMNTVSPVKLKELKERGIAVAPMG